MRRLAPKSVINEVFDLPGSGRSGQELRDFTDPSNRTIYRIYTVSGVRIRPNTLNTTQTRTGPTGFDAGAFIAGDSGSSDGQRALSTAMRNPSDVAVAGNGDLYILDQGNQRVLWVPDPNNINALNFRVAGPFVGNSGDPRSTQLMNPRHVLAAPDGALLVADSDRSVVRRIDPDGGFADVIAGTGNRGGFFDDDNGAATSIPLGWPTGLALGPDGSLYIADRGRHMIFRLKDGQISRFAGTGRADFLGPSGYSPEGRPARDEPLYSPAGWPSPRTAPSTSRTPSTAASAGSTPAATSSPSPAPGPTATTGTARPATAPSSSSPRRSRWGRTGRSTSPTPATP